MIEDLSGYANGQYLLADHGVFHLTITEAADLIAADLWAAGEVVVSGLEDQDLEPSDPQVRAALAETSASFVVRLINSIEHQHLKADLIRRDFDDQILAQYSYIHKQELREWLSERGFDTDAAFEEWEEAREEVDIALTREAAALKAVARGGKNAIRHLTYQKALVGSPNLDDPRSVVASLEACLAENAKLKVQLADARHEDRTKVDRPLNTRARRTLLTIIAALCKANRLEAGARGTSQRIREMTEAIGAPVDDGTIAKALYPSGEGILRVLG
jgi:hypothetical protein